MDFPFVFRTEADSTAYTLAPDILHQFASESKVSEHTDTPTEESADIFTYPVDESGYIPPDTAAHNEDWALDTGPYALLDEPLPQRSEDLDYYLNSTATAEEPITQTWGTYTNNETPNLPDIPHYSFDHLQPIEGLAVESGDGGAYNSGSARDVYSTTSSFTPDISGDRSLISGQEDVGPGFMNALNPILSEEVSPFLSQSGDTLQQAAGMQNPLHALFNKSPDKNSEYWLFYNNPYVPPTQSNYAITASPRCVMSQEPSEDVSPFMSQSGDALQQTSGVRSPLHTLFNQTPDKNSEFWLFYNNPYVSPTSSNAITASPRRLMSPNYNIVEGATTSYTRPHLKRSYDDTFTPQLEAPPIGNSLDVVGPSSLKRRRVESLSQSPSTFFYSNPLEFEPLSLTLPLESPPSPRLLESASVHPLSNIQNVIGTNTEVANPLSHCSSSTSRGDAMNTLNTALVPTTTVRPRSRRTTRGPEIKDVPMDETFTGHEYKCPWDDCDVEISLAQEENVKEFRYKVCRHVRRHLQNQKSCPLACSREFKDARLLRRHIFATHLRAQFHCRKCSQSFTRLASCQRHEQVECRLSNDS